MRIVVITGSPRKKGTSAYLAEQFIKGAKELGHSIVRYDAAELNINGCKGCGYCRKNNGICIQNDIMAEINKDVSEADMVLFVTPLYFFGMSSQLKTVIDRFYAINWSIREKGIKKAMIFMTCNDKTEETYNALLLHYKAIVKNFGWDNCGYLFAQGYNKRQEIMNTEFAKKAYDIGRNI